MKRRDTTTTTNNPTTTKRRKPNLVVVVVEEEDNTEFKQRMFRSMALSKFDWLIHPVSNHVTYTNRCFYIHNQRHSGLTDKLQSTFWPYYSWSEADLSSSSSQPPVKKKKKHRSIRLTHGRTISQQLQYQGMHQGRQLDTHLTTILQLIVEFHLPWSLFNGRDKHKYKLEECIELLQRYNRYHSSLSTPDEIRSCALKVRRMLNVRMSHAFLLIQKWEELGLRLVATQLPVGVYSLCGTNIDCILMDALYQLYIVEIKSGGESSWFKHTAHPMSSPYEFLNDSLLNQALLQAALGRHLYEQTFPLFKSHVLASIVFRVNPKQGVSYHVIPNRIQNLVSRAALLMTASSSSSNRIPHSAPASHSHSHSQP